MPLPRREGGSRARGSQFVQGSDQHLLQAPSPVEASDTTRPRFKSRYFRDGSEERPAIGTDETEAEPLRSSEGEEERRKTTRDIDDLLNDLDILDDED